MHAHLRYANKMKKQWSNFQISNITILKSWTHPEVLKAEKEVKNLILFITNPLSESLIRTPWDQTQFELRNGSKYTHHIFSEF